MLASPVELLPNVENLLSKPKVKATVCFVITKRDLLDQESKLARSGICRLF